MCMYCLTFAVGGFQREIFLVLTLSLFLLVLLFLLLVLQKLWGLVAKSLHQLKNNTHFTENMC